MGREEHVIFVNEFDREIPVPVSEVDLIAKLQRNGLRVLSKPSSFQPQNNRQSTLPESYTPPAFEFIALYDNIIKRIFADCKTPSDRPKDATEFMMLGQDIKEFSELTETEYVRCWMYFNKREEWKKNNVSNN